MVSKKPLVLVVDDEPHICDVLYRILQMEGYQVITARDGNTALAIIENKKPDVVLLDVIMPGIDGREVCRKARELSAATQIIYLTAKVAPRDSPELKELQAEANAFLSKPATMKQVLSAVSSVLVGAQ